MIIKQIPEDFKVEEIIVLPKTEGGDYAYFWLTKKNYTTVRAIQAIARALSVSFARFHFAGTKDANAVTKQLVSGFQINSERLADLKLKDIELKFIGRFPERLALGDLQGNKFEIVLRDLTKKNLNNIKKRYLTLNKKGFTNYFGGQRFGGGSTALIGREIVRGYFKDAVFYLLTYSEKENAKAGKFRKFAKKNFGQWDKLLKACPKFLGIETTILWNLAKIPNDFAGALRKVPKPTRRMYVHAYQSYLWNSAVAAVNGKLKKSYPVSGYETKLGRDVFSKKVKELLAADNLTLDSFRCSRMPELASEGTTRQALVKVKDFEISAPERDELNNAKQSFADFASQSKGRQKVILKFELQKGSYATELITNLTGKTI